MTEAVTTELLKTILSLGSDHNIELSPLNVDDNIQFKTNSENQPLYLDIINYDSSRKRPLVLFFHGGAWAYGSRKRYRNISAALAIKADMVCACVDYSLGTAGQFPKSIADVDDAIKWARDNANAYGINPDQIVLCGTSAGGNVAALSATQADASTKANLNIFICAPTNFSALVQYNVVNEAVHQYLNAKPSENPDKYYAASPCLHVHSDMSPVLLIHGDKDETVPYQLSLDMQAALQKCSVPVELVTFTDGPHSFFHEPPNFGKLINSIEQFIRANFCLS